MSHIESPIIVCHQGNDPRHNNSLMKWSSQIEIIDRDIMLVRGALPFLSDLAEAAETVPVAPSPCMVTDGDTDYVDASIRNSRRLILAEDRCLIVYDVMCRSVEGAYIALYQRLVNRHATASAGSGYELLRYGPGQYFKEHIDVVKDHPILSRRRISVVAFCNDNFVGGELHFPRQKVTITPEPGLLVMFPSSFTHPHESRPILSGTKYSVVTWFF